MYAWVHSNHKMLLKFLSTSHLFEQKRLSCHIRLMAMVLVIRTHISNNARITWWQRIPKLDTNNFAATSTCPFVIVWKCWHGNYISISANRHARCNLIHSYSLIREQSNIILSFVSSDTDCRRWVFYRIRYILRNWCIASYHIDCRSVWARAYLL